jgi:hypothetical protein
MQLLGATVPVVPPVHHPHRRLSRVDHVFTVRAKWIFVEVQFGTLYAYQLVQRTGPNGLIGVSGARYERCCMPSQTPVRQLCARSVIPHSAC